MDTIWYFIIGFILSIFILIFITEDKKGKKKRKKVKSKTTSVVVETNPVQPSHPITKTKFRSQLLETIFTIVLIVLAAVFLVWALTFIVSGIKSFLKPSPKYKTILVYDRTVTINLYQDWNETNTLYLNKGEKCTFKEATVSFCVKNKGNKMVCGEPNTDPNLPNDDLNLKLWFKSQYGQSGTIKVDVYRRERQRIN